VLAGQNCTASGTQSVASGVGSTASARCCIAMGYEATASGSDGVSIGMRNTAGIEGVAMGRNCTASTSGDVAIGYYNSSTAGYGLSTGWNALSNRHGMRSHSAGLFASQGDNQLVEFNLRNKTTNTTATTLFLDGASTRLTIPSGKLLTAIVLVQGVKSDGSAVAIYRRMITIKNVGGTTTLVDSQTLGTDYEDNASTDIAISADNTNDALQINVTGITGETWRWHAIVTVASELAYGT